MKRFLLLLLLSVSGIAAAAEVALVMSVQGRVTRQAETTVPVETFVKLKAGDRVDLQSGARLQLVYFENGRQETWSGSGTVQLETREGKSSGLPPAEVKMLPLVMARQIARTPALDAQGRGGVTRLRSVPGRDALEKLEEAYRDLRVKAAFDDIGPEVFLLAGLYELRELDRVERLIGTLQQDWPNHPQASLLVSLYRKAVKNAREAGAQGQ